MFPPLRMRNLSCSKNNSRNYNFVRCTIIILTIFTRCSVSFCVDYEIEHIYKGLKINVEIREKLGLGRPSQPPPPIHLIGNLYTKKHYNHKKTHEKNPSWGLTHPHTAELSSDLFIYFNLTRPLRWRYPFGEWCVRTSNNRLYCINKYRALKRAKT